MAAQAGITCFNVVNRFNRYTLLDRHRKERSFDAIIQAVDTASITGRDCCPVIIKTTRNQHNNTAHTIRYQHAEASEHCLMKVDEKGGMG